MSPTGGAAAEVAHAAGEAAKLGQRSPRYAITVCGVVASLGLVLAFVYLLMTRPDGTKPIPTTGDWLTRGQFLEALAIRDQKLSPATNDALSEIRGAINSLRSESMSADQVQSERGKALLDTLSRIESRLDAQGSRVDKLYERIIGPASYTPTAGPK